MTQPTLQTILDNLYLTAEQRGEFSDRGIEEQDKYVDQATTQIETIINSELRTKLEGLLAEKRSVQVPDDELQDMVDLTVIPVAVVTNLIESLK